MSQQLQRSELNKKKSLSRGNKTLIAIEKTCRSNLESNYTEKIEELEKSFNYHKNSAHYWSEPEQSILYGTPLYEVASPSQKIALNHLNWFLAYHNIAAGEHEVITYNQVTESVFAAIGGYDTISQELDLETEQERSHIHAFHKIGFLTTRTLLGKDAFKAPLKGKSYKLRKSGLANGSKSSDSQHLYLSLKNLPWSEYRDKTLGFIAKGMLSSSKQYYSQYLKELEQKSPSIPASAGGFWGRGLAPNSRLRFLTFNWGGSPFMACQYYALRYIANMAVKNIEFTIYKYFQKLQKEGEFIPSPTAISYYHLLDEAFHTTTSLFLGRNLYKEFSKPTAYEKIIANWTIYLIQKNFHNGISGASPILMSKDNFATMDFVYKILKSPVFGMSQREALDWMQKCFCQEHEGFHVALKNYQTLLSNSRRFCEEIDYLWPVNREMGLMAAGGSIDKALQANRQTFDQFSRLVTNSVE
ncbi:hypothetical protein [Moorena producens]|uniref:hypothetical protein n=1 Tax=Moorena producens TaxID=1155739 RepID=UPI003C73FACF